MGKIIKNMNKNKIKLLLASFLVGGILILGIPVISADTSAYFNSDPADRPTLLVSNYTDYHGSNANWSTSVSADAGETISFLVYYHNTSSVTANQTRLRVDLPSGNFTSLSVSGRVWANNASAVIGNTSINLSSSQSLSFIPGSVQWYPNNQSQAIYSLPSGQTGSEIISSNGLLLGDIASGWAAQGYVVFRVGVSNNQPQSTGSAPTVTTNSATAISQNSATLNSAVNPNNSATNFWFEYGTAQSLGTTIGYQSVGSGNNSTNFSSSVFGLQPNTIYYYRAVASNSYGTTYGSILSFTTQQLSTPPQPTGSAPTVVTNSATSISQNSATLNGTLNPNNSYTTIWFEYGTTQSLGYTVGYQSAGGGNYLTNISAYLSGLNSITTYYFRAVAQNSFGTTYGSILSFAAQTGATYQPGALPLVYTSVATFIYQNSALLNGTVNPNGSLTTAWFEWGATTALGNKTFSQPMGQGTSLYPLAFALFGLNANTNYYYRAVAQNSYGTVYGNILSFTTQTVFSVITLVPPTPAAPSIPSTPTYPVVIATSTESFVSLSLLTDENDILPGSEIYFAVVYKNIGNDKLTNAVLKIILPSEVDYVSSILPPSSISGKTLVAFNLGNINSDSQGMLNIKVKLNNAAKAGSTLMPSAVIEYTDAAGNFQSVSAYLTINIKSLLASLIAAWGLFLTNWLVYLILLLILIAYMIYRRFFRKETAPVETNVFQR